MILIENGADIEATNRKGKTPIHTAVRNGNYAMIVLLLENGADVRAVQHNGYTLLHLAASLRAQGSRSAKTDQASIARVLLESGADVNAVTRDQNTALHVAAAHGSLPFAKVLIENGANLTAVNTSRNTPLRCAVLGGSHDLVRLLLKTEGDLTVGDKRRHTSLHLAASRGGTPMVRLLLELGADPKAITEKGLTTLMCAASFKVRKQDKKKVGGPDFKQLVEIAQLLADNGVEINTLSNNGKSALHLAAEYGNEALVKFLLDHGITVLAKSNIGETPLRCAARIEGFSPAWNSAGKAKLLVEAAVEIDAIAGANRKETALQMAQDRRNTAVAQVLIQAGAKQFNEKHVGHGSNDATADLTDVRDGKPVETDSGKG